MSVERRRRRRRCCCCQLSLFQCARSGLSLVFSSYLQLMIVVCLFLYEEGKLTREKKRKSKARHAIPTLLRLRKREREREKIVVFSRQAVGMHLVD